MIVFKMFLSGADFNEYEYVHEDIIISHKLFIDDLLFNWKKY